MNNNSKTPANVSKLVSEIEEFIENKKEPDKIVKARVKKIRKKDNQVTLELSEDFNFYKGALVSVNHVSGSVEDKYSNILIISAKEEVKFEEGDNVKIDSSLMNLIISKLENTIFRIKENNLNSNNEKILQFILGNGKPRYHHHNVIFQSETLNSSQKEAVRSSLNADDFHLIVGPPGTGKTYVISEILNQLLNRDDKILITAWTNIAVDNILEKFKDYPPDEIVRIGSRRDVSSVNWKFTLEERRKESDDWNELQELDKLIGNQYQSLSLLNKKRKTLISNIQKLKNKKELYLKSIKGILVTKDKYKEKSLRYKPKKLDKKKELSDIELVWNKLNKKSESYYNLASNLLKLKELDESLLDTDSFYQLENEIKNEKTKGFIKKISSPLHGKAYQKYLDELIEKEKRYEKTKESYNRYWDEREKVEEEYAQLYGDDYGYPQKDSLKKELEQVHLLKKYLPVKKAVLMDEISTSQGMIYESYEYYLSYLDQQANIFREEIAFLDYEMRSKTREHDIILEDMSALEVLIEINKENMQNLISIIDQEILSKAKLVVATVISSANPVLKDHSFKWVVMDEASQVASFISLIPLLLTEKFVLVGDDKQLQPIEESKLSVHLNLSIFNRLIKQFPDSSTFLDTQYRMNEDICNIASELFYEGKLKTFPDVSKQTLDCKFTVDAHELLCPDAPITYLDTHESEYFEDGLGSGCENSKEAELVVRLVNMLEEEGISPGDIGVITPYRRHKINIQNMLNERDNGEFNDNGSEKDEYVNGHNYGNNNGVEVDTVYRFQGREKDVIILSFCNSKLGRLKPFIRKFLEKPNQVNVALTRARKKLIIVGNSKTLKESQLLWKVIKLVGNENTVKFSDEDSNT